MYIYVDVLIIVNVYVNYFLLKSTAKLTHTHLNTVRCILSSIMGSLFSFLIFLPHLPLILLTLIRLLSAILIVFVAFNEKKLRMLFKMSLIFLLISVAFAGVEYAFSLLSNKNSVLFFNSVLYVNISLLTLVISTIISYLIISLFRYYIDHSNETDRDFSIIISLHNKQAIIKAKCDSCNNLVDAFSGRPVIICSKTGVDKIFNQDYLNDIFSDNFDNYNNKDGWRIIPYSTIDSTGLIRCFKPDSVLIKDCISNKIKNVEVYIGISEKDIEYAIFNPKILN